MAEASRARVFASNDPLTAAAIWEAAGIAPSRGEACRMLILVHLAQPLDAAGWHAVAELVGAALEATEDAGEPEAAALSPSGAAEPWIGRVSVADISLLRDVRISSDAPDAGVAPATVAADPEPMGGGIPPEPEAAPMAEADDWAPLIARAPAGAEPVQAAAENPEDDDPFWTPYLDLTLAELMIKGNGKNSYIASQKCGCKPADCIARFKKLLPVRGKAEEEALLARLRSEVEEAA